MNKQEIASSIDYNDIVNCEDSLSFRLEFDDTMTKKERKGVKATYKKVEALLDEMDNLPTEH